MEFIFGMKGVFTKYYEYLIVKDFDPDGISGTEWYLIKDAKETGTCFIGEILVYSKTFATVKAAFDKEVKNYGKILNTVIDHQKVIEIRDVSSWDKVKDILKDRNIKTNGMRSHFPHYPSISIWYQDNESVVKYDSETRSLKIWKGCELWDK